MPAPAIGIDDTAAPVGTHASSTVEMAGVILFIPDLAGIDSLKRLSHEARGLPDQAFIVVAEREA
jgi:hypothetical protein